MVITMVDLILHLPKALLQFISVMTQISNINRSPNLHGLFLAVAMETIQHKEVPDLFRGPMLVTQVLHQTGFICPTLWIQLNQLQRGG